MADHLLREGAAFVQVQRDLGLINDGLDVCVAILRLHAGAGMVDGVQDGPQGIAGVVEKVSKQGLTT